MKKTPWILASIAIFFVFMTMGRKTPINPQLPDEASKENYIKGETHATQQTKKHEESGAKVSVSQKIQPKELERLRKEYLVPSSTVVARHWGASVLGQELIAAMKRGNMDAAAVLAEILDQRPVEDYFFEKDDGMQRSAHFMILTYLYKALEGTPEPINKANYTMEDIPNWQAWWKEGKGQLRLRQKLRDK
jgi:hypothetical protein